MQAGSLAVFIPLFRTNKRLFFHSIDGVSTEHLQQRPGDQSNAMIWIAGHLVSSRLVLTRAVGASIEEPSWNPIFRRGASIEDTIFYPAIDEIAAQWKLVSDRLMNRLNELSEDDLDGPGEFEVPAGEQTIRGAIAFLNFHETYHIGQLAYLRKMFGYGQLVG